MKNNIESCFPKMRKLSKENNREFYDRKKRLFLTDLELLKTIKLESDKNKINDAKLELFDKYYNLRYLYYTKLYKMMKKFKWQNYIDINEYLNCESWTAFEKALANYDLSKATLPLFYFSFFAYLNSLNHITLNEMKKRKSTVLESSLYTLQNVTDKKISVFDNYCYKRNYANLEIENENNIKQDIFNKCIVSLTKQITDNQKKYFNLKQSGKSNKEISKILNIDNETLKLYQNVLKAKLSLLIIQMSKNMYKYEDFLV